MICGRFLSETSLVQSSIYVAESMEASLVVVESCAHIPMDEKSEVGAAIRMGTLF